MTTTTTPQLALTRIFNAPRALVYQAFTDPDHFAAWWGPIGNSLPRDEIVFDRGQIGLSQHLGLASSLSNFRRRTAVEGRWQRQLDRSHGVG